MIKKDWKKQQQKERQARSHSTPSRKDQTKIKSSQGTKKNQSDQTENEKVKMMIFNSITDLDL